MGIVAHLSMMRLMQALRLCSLCWSFWSIYRDLYAGREHKQPVLWLVLVVSWNLCADLRDWQLILLFGFSCCWLIQRRAPNNSNWIEKPGNPHFEGERVPGLAVREHHRPILQTPHNSLPIVLLKRASTVQQTLNGMSCIYGSKLRMGGLANLS